MTVGRISAIRPERPWLPSSGAQAEALILTLTLLLIVVWVACAVALVVAWRHTHRGLRQ